MEKEDENLFNANPLAWLQSPEGHSAFIEGDQRIYRLYSYPKDNKDIVKFQGLGVTICLYDGGWYLEDSTGG